MAATKRRSKVSGAAKASTDHDEIREWAEEKGATPAIVKGTGILRFDFPGFSGEDTLKAIPWKQFFDRFEESKLALLYQDATGSGRDSTFNKLVHRDTVAQKGRRAVKRGSSRKKVRGATRAPATKRKRAPARAKTGGAKSRKRSANRASGR